MKDEFKKAILEMARRRGAEVGNLTALIELRLAFDEATRELGHEDAEGRIAAAAKEGSK
jgi:hypothetical protein